MQFAIKNYTFEVEDQSILKVTTDIKKIHIVVKPLLTSGSKNNGIKIHTEMQTVCYII